MGQFFPLNEAGEVFNVTDEGKLVSENLTCQSMEINHYFGMDMTIDFEQPENGMISNGNVNEPMQFYFSGDDDVWVFVDGVLISDLGGLHDELYTSINFATGEIIRDRAYDPTTTSKRMSTLKQEFENAGADISEFSGDTFADHTTHTMRFFYMERGSNSSNLTMRFNLQYHPSNRLQKMDQNGNGLEGAVFDLYAAKKSDDGTFAVDTNVEEPLLKDIAVSESGLANLNLANGTAFDFGQYEHYILREKKVPVGYIGTPDIWITSDQSIAGTFGLQTGSTALYAENRFDTGVSIAHIMAASGKLVDAELYDGTEAKFTVDAGEKLLLFIVPYVRNLTASNTDWHPFYGSESYGYRTAKDSDDDTEAIEAIIGSIYERYRNDDAADWSFSYDTTTTQLTANVNPIPFTINRYGSEEADVTDGTDLSMRYYFLDLSMFSDFKTMTALEKEDLIASMVRGKLAGSNAETDISEAVHAVAEELVKRVPH